MRYEVRWSNGFWKLFDTYRYTSLDRFYLESEAVTAVAWMNSRKEN